MEGKIFIFYWWGELFVDVGSVLNICVRLFKKADGGKCKICMLIYRENDLWPWFVSKSVVNKLEVGSTSILYLAHKSTHQHPLFAVQSEFPRKAGKTILNSVYCFVNHKFNRKSHKKTQLIKLLKNIVDIL